MWYEEIYYSILAIVSSLQKLEHPPRGADSEYYGSEKSGEFNLIMRKLK